MYPLTLKIYRNSYAYDFYHTGSRKTLTGFNKLAINEIWYLTNDFNVSHMHHSNPRRLFSFQKALSAIKESLTAVGKNTDPVLMVFEEIAEEYKKKFGDAFKMFK